MKTDQQAIESIIETLEECKEYFEDMADADFEGDPGEFIPNEEMKLKCRLSNAISHLKKLQPINQTT